VTLTRAVELRPWAANRGKGDPLRWLRRQVADRKIPYYRVGNRVLIDLEDLDALADAGRVEARRAV
jgi:excisionase family DNA binding protein